MKLLENIKSLIDKKFLLFLLVGVINTIVGAGLMFILYNLFGFGYYFSSVCNYIAGGICSYFLNKFITFKNHQKSFAQIVQFIVLLVVCYIIAYVGAKHLVYFICAGKSVKFRDNTAMITGEILYTVLNYLGQRLVVFKNKQNSEENSESD